MSWPAIVRWRACCGNNCLKPRFRQAPTNCTVAQFYSITVSACASTPRRQLEAERLRGLEVDHHLEQSRLLDRHVGRVRALGDSQGEGGGLVEHRWGLRPVAQQPATGGNDGGLRKGWQLLLQCLCSYAAAQVECAGVLEDLERLGRAVGQRREHGIELVRQFQRRRYEGDSGGARSGLQRLQRRDIGGRRRIVERGDCAGPGQDHALQFEQLDREVRVQQPDAGRVAAGAGKAVDQPVAHGIEHGGDDDRHRGLESLRRAHSGNGVGEDDACARLRQLARERGEASVVARRVAHVEQIVAAFDRAGVGEPLPEQAEHAHAAGRGGLTAVQEADARRGRLRARRDRRECAGGQCEERAPLHRCPPRCAAIRGATSAACVAAKRCSSLATT